MGLGILCGAVHSVADSYGSRFEGIGFVKETAEWLPSRGGGVALTMGIPVLGAESPGECPYACWRADQASFGRAA